MTCAAQVTHVARIRLNGVIPMPEFWATKEQYEADLQKAKEPLLQEIANLTKNRDSILAEKRVLENRHAVTPEGVRITDSHLIVPRKLVRGDARAYQDWRKRAQDQGKELSIDHSEDVQSVKPMPNTFTTDRVHYVSEAYIRGDGAKYRAEKAYAENHKVAMQLCKSADDFPAEALAQETPNVD